MVTMVAAMIALAAAAAPSRHVCWSGSSTIVNRNDELGRGAMMMVRDEFLNLVGRVVAAGCSSTVRSQQCVGHWWWPGAGV
jgi:hypothetical protein